MHRICTSLAESGYSVTLVGRRLPGSLPLKKEKFHQKRLRCWFVKGKAFYAEYNIRLFLYLLTKKIDLVCAIDLDTILPCLKISQWKKVRRVYDAHELFTELKEVISRESIKKAWEKIERHAVPKFPKGYTVSSSIADEFNRRYGVHYTCIRNVPRLREMTIQPARNRYILYQGAVNEARAFEYLVPAMKWVNYPLIICGDGNFMDQLKNLIADHQLEGKITLKGMLSPPELWEIAQAATIGISLAEKEGLNQYLALPNKFFDYIHAGLPQVTMNFPEYRRVNKDYEVALLIDDLAPQRIALAINNLMEDDVVYRRLRENCLKARLELNWQNEEKKLLAFYQSILNS